MTEAAHGVRVPGAVVRRPTRVVTEDRGMRRDVSRLGLLFAGVGSIIGSGWLFGALTASQIAGPAAIVSWVLGGVMILLVGLMLLFSFINVMGVRAFSRFNTAIVWWKLAIIGLVIVALLVTAFQPGHFTQFGGFAPNGAESIFSPVAT